MNCKSLLVPHNVTRTIQQNPEYLLLVQGLDTRVRKHLPLFVGLFAAMRRGRALKGSQAFLRLFHVA